MNVLEFVSAIVVAVLGCSTAMGFILYRKANKRIKAAEAAKEEVNVAISTVEVEKNILELHEKMRDNIREDYVERLNELKTSLDESNRRYHDSLVAGAKKDEIIEDKTKLIRDTNEVVYSLQQKITALEVSIARKEQYIEWLKLWHCSREMPVDSMTDEQKCEGCDRRKPAQLLPLKYIPFKNED